MEIHIYENNEPTELKCLVMPKLINENMNQLSEVFSDLIDNIKLIDFIELYNENG